MLSAGFLKLAQTSVESKPAAVTPAPASPAASTPPVAPPPAQPTVSINATPAAQSPDRAARSAAPASRLAAGVPAYERIYSASDSDVKPAVAVSRPLPKWERPPALKVWGFQGLLEVVVAEDGSVAEAVIVKSIHPGYDRSVIQTAKSWRFLPASLEGRAVKYRMVYSLVVPAP
jgi:TonB family protein